MPDMKLWLGQQTKKKGWTTLDIAGEPDLLRNIHLGLPFPDNTIDEIYAEHFFEHLNPDELEFCLKECMRVLKGGGTLKVSVPDFHLACAQYITGQRSIEEMQEVIYGDFRKIGGSHKFMFDANNCLDILRKAGFKASLREPEDIDQDQFKNHSIYFIGEKQK